ncbi:acyltransferase [Vibrio vulnificus]|uniref:acyltransferase n=1 Tax=Vibrio vulnificus TaxID=672 RepID=UPI0029158CC7|nr:acyltransferase [Vibrio vulnificus]EID4391639.1 acyltransferase [Vibrio vulnificus]ELM6648974.1 acyltransferase [Vibrio vulnificus]EME0909847.1 acyltransferase [Vibrio vulnificus]
MRAIVTKVYLLFLKLFFRSSFETYGTAAPISPFKRISQLLTFKGNALAYWPVSNLSTVAGARYIKIGVGTAPGLSFGCYIFANEQNPIFVGDYTIIAPNVTIAGFSHDLYDYRVFDNKGGIKIGNYCWLAASVTVLPGVALGDHTIVAANSVVTKSFPEGKCVLAGNPAKVVKRLDPDKLVKYENEYKYVGFVKAAKFEEFRKKKLRV